MTGRREVGSKLERSFVDMGRLMRRWDDTWRKVEPALRPGWPKDPLAETRAVARRVVALGEDGAE